MAGSMAHPIFFAWQLALPKKDGVSRFFTPPLFIRPDCKFIATRFCKMKPASSGKGENFFDNFTPCILNRLLRGFQVPTVKNNQPRTGFCRRDLIGSKKASIQPFIGKRTVIRSVIFKCPSKGRLKETLGQGKIPTGKLYIIYFVVFVYFIIPLSESHLNALFEIARKKPPKPHRGPEVNVRSHRETAV